MYMLQYLGKKILKGRRGLGGQSPGFEQLSHI